MVVVLSNTKRAVIMKAVCVLILVVSVAMPAIGQNWEIPEECKAQGFCENVPGYPQETVNDIIAQLPDKSVVKKEPAEDGNINARMGDQGGTTLPDEEPNQDADIDVRWQPVGPIEENIELCAAETRVAYPQAGIDKHGHWHIVFQGLPERQGFRVQICDTSSTSCSPIAFIQPGYESHCVQKHIYQEMAVLDNGAMGKRLLKLPSCCACELKVIRR